MNRAPSVAVLMACHNRRAKTLACVSALAIQTAAVRVHLFLFDDGCEDGTAAAVLERFSPVTILRGYGKAFWAGGMRAAFDRALRDDFDHYLWLNDDVVLDTDALARLLATAREVTDANAGLVLVGGATRDPDTGAISYGGIRRRTGSRNPLRFESVPPEPALPRRCDTLNGNVVLIPRSTARVLGSIGAAYVHTLGDLDYGLRLSGRGGTVVIAAGSVGACGRNPRALRFFDPRTPLGTRWRLLFDPLGFPLRPWLHFARTHGGPFWPVLAISPFWRLLMPFGRRTPARRPAHGHAA